MARRSAPTVLRAVVLVALLLPVIPAAAAASGPSPSLPMAQHAKSGLHDGRLRRAVAAATVARTQGADASSAAAATTVEVLPESSGVRAAISAVGGTALGSVPGQVVLASVPTLHLEALAADPRVHVVRTPIDISGANTPAAPPADAAAATSAAITGSEVARTNASQWIAAGITGAGQRIGIIDIGFQTAAWSAAQAAGELPAYSGSWCKSSGVTCTVWSSAVALQHGVAVAELIHDMAPGAALYLGYARTSSDLQSVMTSMYAAGVRIISSSVGKAYDGPGDGTGPLDTVANNAVAKGITWINSAGNLGGDATHKGAYFRRSWNDSNHNGFLDFANGDDVMGFGCSDLVYGLRWSDWGEAGMTDFDAYVYSDPAGQNIIYTADDAQVDASDQPLESFSFTCPSNGIAYLAVRPYPGTTGAVGDVLEFAVNDSKGVDYWSNPRSASGPIVDSKNPGVITVGALDPATSGKIAYYSAQGPTNDGRIKPDITAPACLQTFTWGSCFWGTSAATPVVAGAAALVRGAGYATAPAAIRSYLVAHGRDRGSLGADSVYGAGELILPPPKATFDVAVGNACASGSSPVTPVTVSLASTTGSVIDRATAGTEPSGTWSVCFSSSHRLVPGFTVSASGSGVSRSVQVPALSLKTDRNANQLRGQAPAAQAVSIGVSRYPGFSQADYPADASAPRTTSSASATANASGQWSVTTAFNLVGGDFVTVSYTKAGDTFSVVEWVEFAGIHIGSSQLDVTMNTGNYAIIDLLGPTGTAKRGSAVAATGYDSWMDDADFVTSTGVLVGVRAGDRISANSLGYKTSYTVPSMTLSVFSSTNVISGSCGVAQPLPYMMTIETGASTVLHFGTATAAGAFSWTTTSTFNLVPGDQVEVTCKLPDISPTFDSAGDRVSRATTAS